MDKKIQVAPTRADPGIQVKIGKAEDCWKTLAALIARRADAIYQRRATTREEGSEIWRLAEAQVEKPLCCGLLRLERGWIVSLNAAEMGASQIEVCVEPHRLILLGKNQATGGTGINDVAVRVLRLPNEVTPDSAKIRRQGPIIDVELHDSTPAKTHTTAAAA